MPASNLWLKIRIWTKVVIAALVALYLLSFIIFNSGSPATFRWWFGEGGKVETSILVLVFFAFLAGIIVTLLVRMMLRTVHQIREARNRGRTERLEREVDEMRTKAAMLRTRDTPPDQSASAAEE